MATAPNPYRYFLYYFVLVILIFFALVVVGQAQGVDPNEMPIGYPNYGMVAPMVDQIKDSPVPRFKAGHTLIPNYSWIDPLYAGGYKQSGVSDATACHNSNLIQYELAKDFNYIILLQWGGVPINDSSVSLANRFPQYKRGITTLRAQTKGCSGSSCLWCACLDGQYYLQNSQGKYLGWGGEIALDQQGNNFKATWRPTSPVSVWNNDGVNAKNYVASSLTNLIGNVDYINENGEIYPIVSNYGLESDPVVRPAMGTKKPQIYLAEKVALLDNAYRDQILSLPKMQGAKYSEYILCGHRTYAFFWEGARNISTPMNGQHYPTTDLYVAFPSNWQNWTGYLHGLKWVTQSRKYEIAIGDKLYSPFFGLGWDNNIQNNVLSAQGLGLAKLLSVYGAEYFFPAYFVTSLPAQEPKSYAYQYLIPIYAQGVTSYMEDILRNGDLMAGDMIDNTNTDEFGTIVPTPFYQFYAGANNKIVAARKKDSEYWITGTIQNSSNVINSTPIESTATINLDGEQLTFKIRRQGSSYYYNKTSKIFYQIDGWHEYSYPTRWTKDVEIEAEVNNSTTGTLKTYAAAAPNYLSYQTVLVLTNNQTASYTVTTRDAATKYLFIKASGSGQLETSWNSNKQTMNFSNGWQKITLGNVSANSHSLIVKLLSGICEIDSLSITSNEKKYPVTTCATPSAIITASNPSPCVGDTIVISVSTNDSYLWSDGHTTQSLKVIESGVYTATVTTNGCSATSLPYTATFKICNTCRTPENIYINNITDSTCTVHWKIMNTNNKTTLIYLKNGTTGNEKILKKESATPQPQVKQVNNLTRTTNYGVRLRSVCGTDTSGYSMTVPFMTK